MKERRTFSRMGNQLNKNLTQVKIKQQTRQSPFRTRSLASQVEMERQAVVTARQEDRNRRRSLVVVQNDLQVVYLNNNSGDTFVVIDDHTLRRNVSTSSSESPEDIEDIPEEVVAKGEGSEVPELTPTLSLRKITPRDNLDSPEEHVPSNLTDEEKALLLSLDEMTFLKLKDEEQELDGCVSRMYSDTFHDIFGGTFVTQDLFVAPVLTNPARSLIARATNKPLEEVEPEMQGEVTFSAEAAHTIVENMVTMSADLKELEKQNEKMIEINSQNRRREQELLAILEVKDNELEIARNMSMVMSPTTPQAASIMKLKLGKLSKYEGKTPDEFDAWLTNFNLWASMANYEGANKTLAFMTYLGTEAAAKFVLEMETRFPGTWKETDWTETEKLALEILGGKPSRMLDALAEAYSFYQGSKSVDEFYWQKKRKLVRATNGEMPELQINAAIMGSCTKQIQLALRNVQQKDTFLEMLHEAEYIVNNEKKLKEKQKGNFNNQRLEENDTEDYGSEEVYEEDSSHEYYSQATYDEEQEEEEQDELVEEQDESWFTLTGQPEEEYGGDLGLESKN